MEYEEGKEDNRSTVIGFGVIAQAKPGILIYPVTSVRSAAGSSAGKVLAMQERRLQFVPLNTCKKAQCDCTQCPGGRDRSIPGFTDSPSQICQLEAIERNLVWEKKRRNHAGGRPPGAISRAHRVYIQASHRDERCAPLPPHGSLSTPSCEFYILPLPAAHEVF